MARDHQISLVKGIVSQTLNKNKGKRLVFAAVALLNGTAQVIQPETLHYHPLSQKLEELPTGGKTNLTAGFEKIHYLIRNEKKIGKQRILFILTDGQINAGSQAHLSPLEEAVSYYHCHLKDIETVEVVDTEHGFVKLNRAVELAHRIKARYHRYAAQ